MGRLRALMSTGLWTLLLAVLVAGCAAPATNTGGGSGGETGDPEPAQGPPSGPASGSIPVGVIVSVTGAASTLGKPERDTLLMVAEEINAAGGIGGKKLELFVYDDESDPTKAVLALKKLLNEHKVVTVIGGTTSTSSLAMIPEIERAQVPFLSLASDMRIATPVKKWVFKVAQGDDLVVPKLLAYLQKRGIRNVAWMNSANDYGEGGKREFEAQAKRYGITAVGFATFKADDKSMVPQLTNLRAKRPEALLVYTTVPSGAIVAQNARQLGYDIPILQSNGIANKAFIEQAKEAAEGVIFTAGKLLVADQLPDSDPQKPILLAYRQAFEAKYNDPANTFGGHAWDAIQMLVAALKAGATEPAAIRDYLERNIQQFVGVTGVFTFTPEDHNGLKEDALVLIEVRNGAWKLLEP
ncbi:ABC transporter substrate-binding protein [Calditerricola yamamurae]